MVKVLFVCTGNICRSPTAEGVFQELVRKAGLEDKITIDSAGTSSWHTGDSPDKRSQEFAAKRGIDISKQISRNIKSKDFNEFDYVIAMDQGNYEALQVLSPEKLNARLARFLTFAPQLNQSDIPDPYYDGPESFENVLNLIEEASQGLLDHILKTDLES